MGPSNLRLAAGVGVVAAVVMVGGPTAAVAIADPGGSHSNRSDHRDRGDDRGGWKNGGDDRDSGYGDNGDGGYGGGRDGGFGADRDGGDRGDRDGSYGGGGDRNPWGDGNRSDGDDDQKSTSGGDSTQRSTSGSNRTSTGSSTASLAPQTSTGSSQASTDDSAPAPQTPADGPGSDTVSGADVAGPPTAEIVQPRVVVGNGRSPGIQPPRSEPPRVSYGVPEIAPAPPPPPPVEIPSAPSDRVHPQRLVPQLGIAPSLDWTDPLWGLAGLIVIPAASAVLGYRQAKAARAAEVLTRT